MGFIIKNDMEIWIATIWDLWYTAVDILKIITGCF